VVDVGQELFDAHALGIATRVGIPVAVAVAVAVAITVTVAVAVAIAVAVAVTIAVAVAVAVTVTITVGLVGVFVAATQRDRRRDGTKTLDGPASRELLGEGLERFFTHAL
jgi:hypothetical protein